MTKLNAPAVPGWPDITRFEVVERLLGGDGGPLNRAPLELLERTEYLKKLIEGSIATALALKAPLASPALSGTPTAPTAAPGTNTTQLANTAFVQAAVAALVASSPAALDTLNELAAALGNDPDFATTITNALAIKAPLASPALTGTPTAPTAAPGTNTTQIANTSFVQAAIAALVASSSLGYGQMWQNVVASRATDTTYYNTTGRPILCSVTLKTSSATATPTMSVVVNGVQIGQATCAGVANATTNMTFIVPPGGSYSITAGTTYWSIANWTELR